MILQKLILNNIRSYEKETINFMEGITLFEGDIGSGKSSILNAIEFALFGLGNQKAAHLLRLGESEGYVELEIKINNQPYIFRRGLKRRGSSVGQIDCSIIENGVQTKYNVTNMKQRVLQILDFNEDAHWKSQSDIYRYAIFTPQEQMREVLRKNKDQRKETLRKAFGIEEYSIAADNTSTLLTEIRSETRALNQSLEELPIITSRIKEERANINNEEGKKKKAEKTSVKIDSQLSELETKIQETKKQKEIFENNITDKRLASQKKEQNKELVKNLNQTKCDLTSSLQKAKNAEQIRNHLEPKYEELLNLREKYPKLEEKFNQSKQVENQIKLLLKHIEGLRTNLETEIKSEKEKLEIINSDKSKAEQANKIKQKLQPKYDELIGLKKQFPDLEKKEKQNQQAINQIQILKEKYTSEKNNLTRHLSSEKNNLQELEKQIQEINQKIKKLPDLLEEAEPLKKQIEKKSDYQKKDQELRKMHAKVDQQLTNLSDQKKGKEREWNDIKKLGVGAPCPRCHQQLTKKHYNQLEQEYQNEIKKIKKEMETKQNNLKETDTKLSENSKKMVDIENTEVKISLISKEILALNTIKETSSDINKRSKTKQETIVSFEKDLKNEIFAIQIKKEIEKHKKITTNLKSDVNKYHEVKTSIRIYEENDLESNYISAKTQAEQLPTLQNQIDNLEKHIEKLELDLGKETYADVTKKEIKSHQKTIDKLKKDVETYHSTKKTIEKIEEEQIETKYSKAKTEANRIPEIQNNIAKTNEKINNLQTKILKIEKQISELEEKIKSMEKIPKELEKLESKKTLLDMEKATQKQIIKSSQENIREIKKRLETLNKDLERHQKNIEHADILRITESWISTVLLSSIQSIEKNVLYSINQEYNKLFKRWFNSLIESDELQGYIDEDFTPIIEQGGYELDVESLSGGEKTSVALAYRLALNTIVKQVTHTMRSNLLILDEPTDGFSRDQLFKLRDILNELGCDQVILVSHEAELESVADSIYRVNKDGNISTVLPP